MSCKVKKHLICLFGRSADPSWPTPSHSIAALNNACQVEEVQEDSADERVKPAERVLPMFFPRNEPEQKTGEQSRPNLPADGIFIVFHEIRQLQGLLDFLEKDFDSPASR